MELRPEVRRFAEAMEERLQGHDEKGGWKDSQPLYLLDLVHSKFYRLQDALRKEVFGRGTPCPQQIVLGAIDMANYAMMLLDVCNLLPSSPEESVAQAMSDAWDAAEKSTEPKSPSDESYADLDGVLIEVENTEGWWSAAIVNPMGSNQQAHDRSPEGAVAGVVDLFRRTRK